MADYNSFCRFYDQVMGDRTEMVNIYLNLLREHHPTCSTVLELACGTGEILKPLSNKYKVYGLDFSKGMLKIAKEKIPGAILFHKNLVSFNITESFDAVLCVFDSMNHILKFSDWENTFASVSHHLNQNGIFIFDSNTRKKLKRMAKSPVSVQHFQENFLILKVTEEKNIYNWKIQIFEKRGENSYQLYEEEIPETTFGTGKITRSLRKNFQKVHIAKDTGDRIFFVCRK